MHESLSHLVTGRVYRGVVPQLGHELLDHLHELGPLRRFVVVRVGHAHEVEVAGREAASITR